MNSTSISTLSSFSENERILVLKQVEEIFFLSSSKKSFTTPELRESFFKRWCGDYIRLFSAEFFIVMEADKVLGYLSGCSDTLMSEGVLSVPGLSVFHDLYEEFPAHLHINFHPDARGKGIGSMLVNHYIDHLRQKNVVAVHLITSPDALNVNFYARLGFVYTFTRDFNGTELYFMGHKTE